MVAYGFKKRFVEPIVKGTKTQTIRGNGKRRHARVGESLQLYCGMRTKDCVKIIADPICSLSVLVEIALGVSDIHFIAIGGIGIDDFHTFANADGFADLGEMHEFWLRNYGVGHFSGTLIGWEPCIMSQWRDVAELIESELVRIEGESMHAAQRAQHPDAGTECAVDAIAELLDKSAKVRLRLGDELFRFTSFPNWVNKAKDWFRGVPSGSWVCIDQQGRICNSGKEFMRADKEGQFPIVVYAIDPEAKS